VQMSRVLVPNRNQLRTNLQIKVNKYFISNNIVVHRFLDRPITLTDHPESLLEKVHPRMRVGGQIGESPFLGGLIKNKNSQTHDLSKIKLIYVNS
jgi:hypothetical protein